MGSIEDQINQGVFEFSYLLNGLRQTLERPNQLTTSYTYDNLGRLERITHENSASQILERFDYTYDVDTIDGTGNPVYKGMRTKRMMTSNFISGTTQHYAYNGQGWLTRAKYIDSASGTEAFTYDTTGNRTNRTWTPSLGYPVTSTNFTMAPHSDLVTQAGTIGTMDYSVGGNLIDDNWTGREYEWDQFNRVTMVKSATGTPLYGFEYGGTGERQVQNTYTSGQISSTRAFLYDREDVIAEFSNDTFATLFRRYIHGPGIDEPLAILGDDTGEYTYYLHDGLGSVTGVVDESGKLAGSINYSAFGETRSNTVKIENRYRYTSRECVETNLYYYRARHMRPDLGRFISMDPLKMIDGTNMFGYVGNDPINHLDPYGTWPTWRQFTDGVKHFCNGVLGDSIFSGGSAICDPNLTCELLRKRYLDCVSKEVSGQECPDCQKIYIAYLKCIEINNTANNQSNPTPGPGDNHNGSQANGSSGSGVCCP